jgi:hypothetical protein
VKNREVLRKDGAARKTWNGQYHERVGKPLRGRQTLRRELLKTQVEILGGQVSGNVRSKALERGGTSRGVVRAERIPDKAAERTNRAVVKNDEAGAEPRGRCRFRRWYLAEAANRRRATDRREAIAAGR